jgi:hypothetical protein
LSAADSQAVQRHALGRFLRDNGLTLTLAALFLFAIAATGLSGWAAHNGDLVEHGGQPIGLLAYLGSGDFASAVFENWESEFLQMAAYVVLTAFLFQRGSAESRDPDDDSVPDPIRPIRSLVDFLRAYSLGIVLAVLFVASFLLHLWGSYRAAVAEALLHGDAPHGFGAHLGEAQFWFESFQNWQSEFLATGVLVVLSIFLRFRGSPESKPEEASDAETGAQS